MRETLVILGTFLPAIGLVLNGLAIAAQDDLALPAPLQVEAVTRDLAGRITSDRTGEPRVVVNLGASEGKPWPTWETHTRITLLGTQGSMPAQLVEIIKVCESLCGEESEECHYEARYVPSGTLDMVGTPVAALPGNYAISDYTGIPEGAPRAELSADGLSEDFVEAIWPEENPADARHRFRRSEDSFVLEYAWGDRGEQTVPANGCEFYPRGLFVRMACNGIEALLADRTPILVSFPDYNSPDVDVIASFTHADRTYYIARFALKAQTVHGLLYQDGDGWRARFHLRDYALLC